MGTVLKISVEKISGSGSQGAWPQGELFGHKQPVVKLLCFAWLFVDKLVGELARELLRLSCCSGKLVSEAGDSSETQKKGMSAA
jgi:hypothetical protein